MAWLSQRGTAYGVHNGPTTDFSTPSSFNSNSNSTGSSSAATSSSGSLYQNGNSNGVTNQNGVASVGMTTNGYGSTAEEMAQTQTQTQAQTQTPRHNVSSHSHSHSHSSQPNQAETDKPIGYGAFGVVWAVTDPRDGKRIALKKLPNAFQSTAAAKRVYRELLMLCHLKHDNIVSAVDILQPPAYDQFREIYVLTELMQTDLHRIIVSPQPLTGDHVKVFLYQILRGLKYLHSARVIHRDIKPGNLLVNSNCCLKVCDFGLARVEEPDEQRRLTLEVVTQYYRAPELLMGASHYAKAVDMWSVGCIFAELLSRRILFQAQTPIQQLDMITDLLGSPSASDIRQACPGARAHLQKQKARRPNLNSLFQLSTLTSQCHDAVHLLCRMLVFDPDKRITAADALAHPFVDEGRLRFHSCMCSCCRTVNGSSRVYAGELDPVCNEPFDYHFDADLLNVSVSKQKLYKFIMEYISKNRVPLCLNPNSAAFKHFINSSAAHPSELPPSPQCWDKK